jgi:formate dehydrogenase gamma subunit
MSGGDVVRFSARQRVEHVLVMVLFLVLALTGMPQKFHDSGWGRFLVDALGGIVRVRLWHRWAGLLFVALTVGHLVTAVVLVASRRVALTMVPTRQDFLDTLTMLRYYLRLSDERARFDRFDYREKFEYWGLVIGALVMSLTGLILYFPIAATRLAPGELVPVSKVVHSSEGLLAFLVVITWHVWNAHFAPGVFPFNPTIFTGRISREHLKRDHPLEYERLFPEEAAAQPAPTATAAGPASPPARSP